MIRCGHKLTLFSLLSPQDKYRMAQAKIESTKVLAYRLEDMVLAKNTPGEW